MPRADVSWSSSDASVAAPQFQKDCLFCPAYLYIVAKGGGEAIITFRYQEATTDMPVTVTELPIDRYEWNDGYWDPSMLSLSASAPLVISANLHRFAHPEDGYTLVRDAEDWYNLAIESMECPADQLTTFRVTYTITAPADQPLEVQIGRSSLTYNSTYDVWVRLFPSRYAHTVTVPAGQTVTEVADYADMCTYWNTTETDYSPQIGVTHGSGDPGVHVEYDIEVELEVIEPPGS